MKIDSAPPSAILPDVEADAQDKAPPVAAVPLQPVQEAVSLRALGSAVLIGPTPFSPRMRRTALTVAGLLCAFLLLRLSGILTPFLWAIVVAYAFNPVIGSIGKRTGLPRGAIVGGIYVLGISGFILLLSITIPRLNQQVTEFSNDLPTIATDLQNRYFGPSSQPIAIGPFNVDVPQASRQIAGSLNSALSNFFVGTFTALTITIERVTQFLLFVIVTFYLLLDAPRIGAYFAAGIPKRHREEVLTLAHDIDQCLSQYLRAQLLLIAIMSTAAFIVLSIMGVRFAIVLAPIAGVLEIFPIIGPFAAITTVTLVAIFSPPHYGLSHTSSALIVAVVFFVLRQIEDYAVIPNVVGHAVRLHPALILFAVAAGASLGGALGLFLAVPLTGALKVIMNYLYRKLEPAE